MSRRRQCLHELHHSLKDAGSETMDTEMAESLGITIASSDREPHAPIPSPISSVSYKDGYSVFEESYEIACYLRHYMDDLKNCDGTDKFLEWPECFHFWDPYWGVSTIMTHAGQAEAQPEALTITVHSRAAIDTEILTSEFVVCYLAAQMAWHYDSDHQELKKASEGTRRRWPRLGKWICGRRKSKVTECKVTEESMLELRSPMRGLPIRLVSIHGLNIRILTTYFTEEYYQSFKKADQSTAGRLCVRIESFRLPNEYKTEIDYVMEKLTTPSTWLQEQMKTSNQ